MSIGDEDIAVEPYRKVSTGIVVSSSKSQISRTICGSTLYAGSSSSPVSKVSSQRAIVRQWSRLDAPFVARLSSSSSLETALTFSTSGRLFFSSERLSAGEAFAVFLLSYGISSMIVAIAQAAQGEDASYRQHKGVVARPGRMRSTRYHP